MPIGDSRGKWKQTFARKTKKVKSCRSLCGCDIIGGTAAMQLLPYGT
jgi:hypothetical protein